MVAENRHTCTKNGADMLLLSCYTKENQILPKNGGRAPLTRKFYELSPFCYLHEPLFNVPLVCYIQFIYFFLLLNPNSFSFSDRVTCKYFKHISKCFFILCH